MCAPRVCECAYQLMYCFQVSFFIIFQTGFNFHSIFILYNTVVQKIHHKNTHAVTVRKYYFFL